MNDNELLAIAVKKYMQKKRKEVVHGKSTQYGTPSPDNPVPIYPHNGLPGIPVSTGGNYTDENGQQWVCDEVDFARGKYIQRIQKLVFDGSEYFRPNATDGYYLDFAKTDSDDAYVGMGSGSDGEQRFMCSHFAVQPKYVNVANRTHGMVIIYTSSGNCRLYFTLDGTDMATYCAEQYAAGNPVTVLYQRVIPIETDLQPDLLESGLLLALAME